MTKSGSPKRISCGASYILGSIDLSCCKRRDATAYNSSTLPSWIVILSSLSLPNSIPREPLRQSADIPLVIGDDTWIKILIASILPPLPDRSSQRRERKAPRPYAFWHFIRVLVLMPTSMRKTRLISSFKLDTTSSQTIMEILCITMNQGEYYNHIKAHIRNPTPLFEHANSLKQRHVNARLERKASPFGVIKSI